nr:MAG TPA: hypothetical protein [Caudoviricetes sp.]
MPYKKINLLIIQLYSNYEELKVPEIISCQRLYS